MGIEIDQRAFAPDDYRRFSDRLEVQLARLAELLERPGFGEGTASLGSELELYIVDGAGRPAYLNEELHSEACDPQLTLELDRYNLEYNLSAYPLAGRGLFRTEQEMLAKVAGLNAIAADRGVGVVPIGILPTLSQADLGAHSLTNRLRYHALVEQLVKWRGSAFEVNVDGPEPLQLAMADITLEGANTSFQVHWRVTPQDYAALFNAVQLVTPVVLAVSANSPGIFGHDLWDETRIPLFKQSIDTRHNDPRSWHEPARVSFGQGWVRQGAHELFAESVRLFPPLLPCCAPTVDTDKATPELAELRLHQSTVWLWNRPVYDDADGGHLRIEMRALPAGPTALDMVAGAAFAIGLAKGLQSSIEQLLPALPFSLAERNFYRAAQSGLDADLVWPSVTQRGLEVRPVRSVARDLLPLAAEGLSQLGVAGEDVARYLEVIEGRLDRGMTGARWQRVATARRTQAGESKSEALAGMLVAYRELSASNLPVAEWPTR